MEGSHALCEESICRGPQEFKTNRGRVADETPQRKRLLVVLVPPGGSPLPTVVPKAVNMPQGACANPKAAGGEDAPMAFTYVHARVYTSSFAYWMS